SLKEPAAQADPLILRTQIDLVDFALLLELTGTAAPQRGVTRNLAADLHDEHCRRTPDRIRPPSWTAAADHSIERTMRDDARIGTTPGRVVHGCDRVRVTQLGSANVDR